MIYSPDDRFFEFLSLIISCFSITMMMMNVFLILSMITCLYIIIRVFFSGTTLFYLSKRLWRSIDEKFHVYQFYKVPEYNNSFQENQLFKKVSTYVSSLSAIEDSDFANLFSGAKSNEIAVQLDANQTVYDSFLSARISWRVEEKGDGNNNFRTFVLKMKKRDKRRILRPYLQHIHSISDEIELRKKEIKLYTNTETSTTTTDHGLKWRSIPFTHPSNLDTVAMDSDLKNKVKSDLESFLKAKTYYHRLGRVWKRSYLLHGPPGTGKSSFIAAMAKFLNYDVYDIDLSQISDDSDLKMLLLSTTNRSVIVIEDLDRFIHEKSTTGVSLSGILNFMDGIFSCCGEERVMVITMNNKENIDQSIMRPGRIDVQIYFPLCDFSAFKTLASSYLGLKDHKLFPQVEEIFQTGKTLSPAEIGEIMIVNRSSPSRALKSVITALQTGSGKKKSDVGSGKEVSGEQVICRESVHTVREFRKLYGLLRLRSGRKTPSQSNFDLSTSSSTMEKDG